MNWNIFKRKPLPEVHPNLESVIIELKVRSKRFRKIATNYLLGIFLVTIFGLYTFTFAYQFNANTRLFDMAEDILSYDMVILNDLDGRKTDSKGGPVDFEDQRFLILQNVNKSTSLIASNIKEYLKSDNYIRFFETLSTRVGSVIILLFLVQMLIRVFRYNIRLANYYQARADALEICLKSGQGSFDQIVNFLSPDSIDIGMSQTPTEQIIEVLKNAPRMGNKG
jgi:hypothetical protein